MSATTSADGTTIAYDRAGRGPAMIFVAGAFNLRNTCAPLAAELASDHTVINYDRRGRGDSTDTSPYAIEREVEDLQALVDDAHPSPPEDLPERLQALLDEGKPGEVVATFQIEGIGLPEEVVSNIRQSPIWPQLEAMAQSVVYDATITGTLKRPTSNMTAVSASTLIMQAAETWPLLADAAVQLTDRLPNATRTVLAGTGGTTSKPPVPQRRSDSSRAETHAARHLLHILPGMGSRSNGSICADAERRFATRRKSFPQTKGETTNGIPQARTHRSVGKPPLPGHDDVRSVGKRR